MNDGSKITPLLELSRNDAATARAGAEKKSLEAELIEKRTRLQRSEIQTRERGRVASEYQSRVQKEQDSIKEERERLTQRRKALGTLGSYKLQQAAEREVQYAARELVKREEVLNTLIREWEGHASEYKALQESLASEREALVVREGEIVESLRALEQRVGELTAGRAELLSRVDPAARPLYDRIRSRYPTDPLTTLQGGSCAACFIQVSAQLVVQVLRGDSLVRCNGCGRILYATTAE